MDLRVGGVAELVRASPPPGFSARISSARAIAPFMPFSRGVSTTSAPRKRQHLAPLDRDQFRHGQDQPVAARGADEGKPDAGVAGGRLDQDRTRADLALGLERLDHRHADPVLDAGDRVEELELKQEVGRDPLLRREPARPAPAACCRWSRRCCRRPACARAGRGAACAFMRVVHDAQSSSLAGPIIRRARLRCNSRARGLATADPQPPDAPPSPSSS